MGDEEKQERQSENEKKGRKADKQRIENIHCGNERHIGKKNVENQGY